VCEEHFNDVSTPQTYPQRDRRRRNRLMATWQEQLAETCTDSEYKALLSNIEKVNTMGYESKE